MAGSARAVPAASPIDPISSDHWFIKSNEFRLWLREERSLNLFEMETVDGKRLFNDEFVPAWNAGKLWAKYYRGVEAAHQAGRGKTWSHSRDDELSKVVSDVKAATNFVPASKRGAAGGRDVDVGPSVGPPRA